MQRLAGDSDERQRHLVHRPEILMAFRAVPRPLAAMPLPFGPLRRYLDRLSSPEHRCRCSRVWERCPVDRLLRPLAGGPP